MARRLGERPLGATGTGERAQRGLAEGRWGMLVDAGGPRGRGFAPDWRLSGKGRGRLPSGVLTNPVCPAGRRQRGCSCGRCAGAEEAWSSLWLGRCPRSRFTGERRAARARPAARRRGCSLLRGDNVRGRRPTSPSWALRLEQPLAPLWTPFTMSPLHPSPFDGCLGATPGWQNLRPLCGQRADGVTTAPCSVGG